MITHVSCLCTDEEMTDLLYSKTKNIGVQVQKFNRLLVEGYIANGEHVIQLSALPMSNAISDRLLIPSKEVKSSQRQEIYLPLVNVPLIKDLCLLFTAFFKCLFSKEIRQSKAIVCDVLAPTISLSATIVAHMFHIPVIAVITDFPEFVSQSKLFNTLTHFVIDKANAYVVMTDEMMERLDQSKPYAVIEGMIDQSFVPYTTTKSNKKKICLYSGDLSVSNGIKTLVEAFQQLPDIELHLYGNGDYVETLTNAHFSNVIYHGMVKNEEVLLAQSKADLLVNPRPTNQDFTKYSFPSKLMEYMLSGTPTCTTRLKGITKEYNNYMFYFDDESVNGFAQKINEILKTDEHELTAFAKAAQQYVMKHKTNQAQTKKIINLIDTLNR